MLCCSVYTFQTESPRVFYCKVCCGEFQIEHKAVFLLTLLRFRSGLNAGWGICILRIQLGKFMHWSN